MSKHRLVKAGNGYVRSLISQDGQHIRREWQDISPIIQHVEKVRHMHEHATKASNPNEWRHEGTIPMTVLIDWLWKNNYTMDQWARNDGGIPGKRYPNSRSGVKDKFLAYFMSRDFSKLHNHHVTTRKESNFFAAPERKPNGTIEQAKS